MTKQDECSISAHVLMDDSNVVIQYHLNAYIDDARTDRITSHNLGMVKYKEGNLPYLTAIHPKIVSAVMPLLIAQTSIEGIGEVRTYMAIQNVIVKMSLTAHDTQLTSDEFIDIQQEEYWICENDVNLVERVVNILRRMEQENLQDQ
jgi:ribosomal protein S13